MLGRVLLAEKSHVWSGPQGKELTALGHTYPGAAFWMPALANRAGNYKRAKLEKEQLSGSFRSRDPTSV